jgi:hypothetical protein
MRPFHFSGKTARQACGALTSCRTRVPDTAGKCGAREADRSFRVPIGLAGLTLFSAVVEPGILFRPTSRRRSGGRERVIPDASPRQRQDLTTPQEGPQKNLRGGICPFRYLTLGYCGDCTPQARCADLRGHNRRRGNCRGRHHPVRYFSVKSRPKGVLAPAEF